MKKSTKILIFVGVAAVVLYFGIRWYENRKAAQLGNAQGGAPGGLGTNLNSVAPELIGGSTGPSIGPAVSTPITITIDQRDSDGRNDREGGNPLGAGAEQIGSGVTTRSPLDLANPGGPMTGEQDLTPIPDIPDRFGPPTVNDPGDGTPIKRPGPGHHHTRKPLPKV